jgi:hypothetical protein
VQHLLPSALEFVRRGSDQYMYSFIVSCCCFYNMPLRHSLQYSVGSQVFFDLTALRNSYFQEHALEYHDSSEVNVGQSDFCSKGSETLFDLQLPFDKTALALWRLY